MKTLEEMPMPKKTSQRKGKTSPESSMAEIYLCSVGIDIIGQSFTISSKEKISKHNAAAAAHHVSKIPVDGCKGHARPPKTRYFCPATEKGLDLIILRKKRNAEQDAYYQYSCFFNASSIWLKLIIV